ncbi:uncharacterized protein KD926_006292 [Aspergillus affinis]|uniref:uncharacterized protein n=1 Tax=Aspergillus affinis TaxID=1070780 RepID=UPI0022FEF379|nr:uncharacterized protein KD926_006292 [Aspergillus affinis]KAI9041955.1 hypothetical protein KD926_006292 [Aspergillus affinis]
MVDWTPEMDEYYLAYKSHHNKFKKLTAKFGKLRRRKDEEGNPWFVDVMESFLLAKEAVAEGEREIAGRRQFEDRFPDAHPPPDSGEEDGHLKQIRQREGALVNSHSVSAVCFYMVIDMEPSTEFF